MDQLIEAFGIDAKLIAVQILNFTVLAAHGEAEEVTLRARTHAEGIHAEAVKDAEDKAAAILADAKARGEQIAERARTESEAEIAQLAVLAAEKILREKAS